MKEVSKIEKDWIIEIAGHYYEDKTKQVITERQISEITNNQKVAKKNEIYDKNSISNILSNRANEKFVNSNLSFSTKRNPNRIYMEVDKNKSYDYYLNEIEENQIDLNQLKSFKKTNSHEPVNNNNNVDLNKDDEELDNITLLRRMRNRINK
jgi:hypothetical protein